MAVNKLPQAFDVEPMKLGDLDAVMEIEGASFRSPMPARMVLEEMGREWAHIDVVRDRLRRNVTAFSNYWVVADEVHLLNLATHPEARRAGHASRLLAHIIEVGRSRKCRFVTLEVRRSNAAAVRLYRRFGFRAVGVRPNYYAEDQEDAIVMLLDLG
ncbi:MAG TPA: ribosomal protein S18-alanine N-acetyltransferase [Polyangia bacterium]|nr:ribosomal protein S18-alanine N-acetyltransferase [Polyangia bacterium]